MGRALAWFGSAALVTALAACGAATPKAGPSGGGPGVTAEPETSVPTTARESTGQPPGTGTAGGRGATTTTGPPLTVPLRSSLGGVPTRPLPNSGGNAKANAQYACRWYSDLSELLADASSQPNVARQGREDIRQLAAFARNAGAGSTAYAKLASDAAKLQAPGFLARLAHPADLPRSPAVVAVGTDCASGGL